MKFEEAYCTKLNKLLTIDDVTFYYKYDKQFYIQEIKKYLICPECKQPNLEYNNAENPYFSTYPDTKHDINCSLKQKEMSPKQTAKFISNPDNNDIVLRQMDSILTMLMGNCTSKKSVAGDLNKPTNQIKNGTKRNSPATMNRIPRKRIDVAFSEEDFNCDKLFYGSVHLKWEKGKRTINGKVEEYYKILLYGTKKNNTKLLARLRITQKVYNFLPNNYKIPNEYNCKIVFLANFPIQRKKEYQTTSIKTSQMIILEKFS